MKTGERVQPAVRRAIVISRHSPIQYVGKSVQWCWAGLIAMRMSCRHCFMIFLLISAQADDTWVVPSAWPAPPLADDDEYIPSDQHVYQERSDARQVPVFARPRTAVANIALIQSNSRRQSKLTDYLASLFLYVFMSLQR
jgi:hypothetical protein